MTKVIFQNDISDKTVAWSQVDRYYESRICQTAVEEWQKKSRSDSEDRGHDLTLTLAMAVVVVVVELL